jgi:hypothetical protein
MKNLEKKRGREKVTGSKIQQGEKRKGKEEQAGPVPPGIFYYYF